MPDPFSTLVLHAAVTWALAGVIWFVQLVHYPAYREFGDAEFLRFQARSPIRTGWIVVPLMLVELGTAAWLAWRPPAGMAAGWLWFGALLIAVNWTSTALLQAPLHFRLQAGRDPAALEHLIRGNWIRTMAWSIRAVLATTWLLSGYR